MPDQKPNQNEKLITKLTHQQPRKTEAPRKSDISASIEALIQTGQLTQAMDVAIKSIGNGVMPKPNVLKYLLKNLAQEGNVEKIQQLGEHLTEDMKRKVTYDDKLTLAIVEKGAGSEHVQQLYEAVQAATSDAELEAALRKFPRSNALASIMKDDELLAKCEYQPQTLIPQF